MQIMKKNGLSRILTLLLAATLAPVFCFSNAVAAESESSAGSTTESVAGPLDGLSFKGMLGPDGKPKDVPDLFVFENGTFVSKECELRCKYPARPYFVRRDGEKIEFISETQCPYKDAKIIWRGSIEGDRIQGTSTWVVKRWYWTHESNFEFEGKLTTESTATASSE